MARTAAQESARLDMGKAILQAHVNIRSNVVTVKAAIDSLIAQRAVIVAGVESGAYDAADVTEIDTMLATYQPFSAMVDAYLASP